MTRSEVKLVLTLSQAGIEGGLFRNDREVPVAPQTSEIFRFNDARRCLQTVRPEEAAQT